MKYMGSKRRIAKHILPIMIAEADRLGITKWIEPFVGGANLIDKVPDRFERVGYDLNEHVIYALKDIRDNPNSLDIELNEDIYNSFKGRVAEEITSWVRIACSYGGIFESKLAADKSGKRDYHQEAYRNAQKQQPLIQGVDFIHADYRDLSFKDSLIYCDPPYQNTSGYKTGDFNHEEFFEWCRSQKENGNVVFVSEYEAPFTEVWRGEIKTNFASSRKKATHDAIEKLFLV